MRAALTSARNTTKFYLRSSYRSQALARTLCDSASNFLRGRPQLSSEAEVEALFETETVTDENGRSATKTVDAVVDKGDFWDRNMLSLNWNLKNKCRNIDMFVPHKWQPAIFSWPATSMQFLI